MEAPETTVSDQMESAMQYAKKFTEDVLSFFGLNLDIAVSSSDGEVIEVDIPSSDLNGFLIGQRGENMRSLQFLISTALKNNGHDFTRVNLDVAEYKRQRADRLKVKAEDWMKRVKESAEPMELRNMNAADRRVIHQLAAEHGLVSESVGEGRDRHIVLKTEE
jgi:spoIIIJ-associated protein